MFASLLGNLLTGVVTGLTTDLEGNSMLSMTQELWFWAGLIFIAAAIFVPVAKSYQPKEYLQEEGSAADSGGDLKPEKA